MSGKIFKILLVDQSSDFLSFIISAKFKNDKNTNSYHFQASVLIRELNTPQMLDEKKVKTGLSLILFLLVFSISLNFELQNRYLSHKTTKL